MLPIGQIPMDLNIREWFDANVHSKTTDLNKHLDRKTSTRKTYPVVCVDDHACYLITDKHDYTRLTNTNDIFSKSKLTYGVASATAMRANDIVAHAADICMDAFE